MDAWLDTVKNAVETFARRHRLAVSSTKRVVSASFEIGCFHAVIEFYRKSCSVLPQNLNSAGEFRYLTSPNGDPRNFSFVLLKHPTGNFFLRQQIRIRSHIHRDIAFTPDLVVLPSETIIGDERDADYAGGKRSVFSVSSRDVVAAHECKSLDPFPELLVSFIGMLTVAHQWMESPGARIEQSKKGLHLAPSLFVGGLPRPFQSRMVRALEETHPINIVAGLHAGTWDLTRRKRFDFLSESPGVRSQEFSPPLLLQPRERIASLSQGKKKSKTTGLDTMNQEGGSES